MHCWTKLYRESTLNDNFSHVIKIISLNIISHRYAWYLVRYQKLANSALWSISVCMLYGVWVILLQVIHVWHEVESTTFMQSAFLRSKYILISFDSSIHRHITCTYLIRYKFVPSVFHTWSTSEHRMSGICFLFHSYSAWRRWWFIANFINI